MMDSVDFGRLLPTGVHTQQTSLYHLAHTDPTGNGSMSNDTRGSPGALHKGEAPSTTASCPATLTDGTSSENQPCMDDAQGNQRAKPKGLSAKATARLEQAQTMFIEFVEQTQGPANDVRM